MQGAPQSLWGPQAPGCTGGEPFEEALASPARPAACGGEAGVAHLPDEFRLLARKWSCGSHRAGGLRAALGPAAPQGPGQAPARGRGQGGLQGPELCPLAWGGLSSSWREGGRRAGFAALRCSAPGRSGPALESHVVGGNKPREVRVWGRRGRARAGGCPPRGMMLADLGLMVVVSEVVPKGVSG